jgi:hypothetical protein
MAGQMHVRPAASAVVPSPAGMRGQASGSGDGQQARREAPDAIG